MRPSYVTLTDFFSLRFVLGTLGAPLWHYGHNNDKVFISKLTTLRQLQLSRSGICATFIDPLWDRTRGSESVPFGYIYGVRPLHSSHLSRMKETKKVSETLGTNSIFTRIFAPENFITNSLIDVSSF
jgi:hypothetical protein